MSDVTVPDTQPYGYTFTLVGSASSAEQEAICAALAYTLGKIAAIAGEPDQANFFGVFLRGDPRDLIPQVPPAPATEPTAPPPEASTPAPGATPPEEPGPAPSSEAPPPSSSSESAASSSSSGPDAAALLAANPALADLVRALADALTNQ